MLLLKNPRSFLIQVTSHFLSPWCHGFGVLGSPIGGRNPHFFWQILISCVVWSSLGLAADLGSTGNLQRTTTHKVQRWLTAAVDVPRKAAWSGQSQRGCPPKRSHTSENSKIFQKFKQTWRETSRICNHAVKFKCISQLHKSQFDMVTLSQTRWALEQS